MYGIIVGKEDCCMVTLATDQKITVKVGDRYGFLEKDNFWWVAYGPEYKMGSSYRNRDVGLVFKWLYNHFLEEA